MVPDPGAGMRLRTLGTGTAAPHPSRVSAGHLLDVGAVRLLMDCGSGVMHRLAEFAVAWPTITHVALTHFHLDHVGELPALLFASRYGVLPPRSAPLTVIGPTGTADLLARMAVTYGEWVSAPGFPLVVREILPGETLPLDAEVAIEARAVPHTAESVAYSIVRGPRRVVYTGDTGWDEGLGGWAAGADLLLTECSLPEESAIPQHLTPTECGALAALARPGLLVLTHFYPPVERVDVVSRVRARWDGGVALAHDGMLFTLEDD